MHPIPFEQTAEWLSGSLATALAFESSRVSWRSGAAHFAFGFSARSLVSVSMVMTLE
jgi:hypothetical protein